jgi:hypothetical protein
MGNTHTKKRGFALTTFFVGLKRLIREGKMMEGYKREIWPQWWYFIALQV